MTISTKYSRQKGSSKLEKLRPIESVYSKSQQIDLAKLSSENPNPVLRISSGSIILYANKASKSLLDTWETKLGNKLPKSFSSRIEKTFKLGKVMEFAFVCIDNNTYILTLVPVVDSGYVNVYGHDISERRKAEQALQNAHSQLEIRVQKRTEELSNAIKLLKEQIIERENAEKAILAGKTQYKELFDNMRSGVAVYEAVENGTDFVFKNLNKAGERLSRVKREDVIAKKLTEMFPGVKEFGLFDVLQKVWKTGKPEHHPVSLYKDDKVTAWYENYVYKLPSGEIVTVYDDITEKKQMEETLRESERLAAKGQLAAGIAHEINNPLASIKNSFMLIKDAIPKDHRYYHYVKLIDKEINRVNNVVRQMFGLYKNGRENVFSVNDVIDEVIAMLAVNIKNGVSLKFEGCKKEISVGITEASLREVLYNIVENAIEASFEGKQVSISSKVDGENLIVTIADKGIGIEPDVLPRIFDSFFTTKKDRVGSGLGLGLSISKGIVESAGGSISVTSEPSKGTIFNIIIPCR